LQGGAPNNVACSEVSCPRASVIHRRGTLIIKAGPPPAHPGAILRALILRAGAASCPDTLRLSRLTPIIIIIIREALPLRLQIDASHRDHPSLSLSLQVGTYLGLDTRGLKMLRIQMRFIRETERERERERERKRGLYIYIPLCGDDGTGGGVPVRR